MCGRSAEFLPHATTPWIPISPSSQSRNGFVAILAAWWVTSRLIQPGKLETFIICFGLATLMRYMLRKEFLQDIRGLRRALPRESEIKLPR